MAARVGKKNRESRGRQNLILGRYWEIVNMYPTISDPELARRIEEFTMNATPEQLFHVQQVVIAEGAAYMKGDRSWMEILERMEGERVGLAIGKEYETTVTVSGGEVHVEMGIEDRSIPVLSVASRKDYVDALLRRKDIVRMLVTGRLKATRKLTLVRWGLSFFDLLKDDTLFDDFISHQATAEKKIKEAMGAGGGDSGAASS